MSATTNSIQDEKYCSKPNLLHFEISKIHTLLALICPALGGQIDFLNLALRAGQNEAGQNWASCNFLLKIIRHVRLYVYN